MEPLGYCQRNGLLPLALGLQDQLHDLADGTVASRYRGDVVRGTFHLHDGVSDRHRQPNTLQKRQIRQIVADVSDFFVRDAGANENRFIGLQFFRRPCITNSIDASRARRAVAGESRPVISPVRSP